jgi:hypothetical protein
METPMDQSTRANSPQDSLIFEPTTDSEYFGWLNSHQHGFVLNVQGKKQPMIHRASCTHIDRHNNAGAMTERNARKLCGEERKALRTWMGANGYSGFPRKCECM